MFKIKAGLRKFAFYNLKRFVTRDAYPDPKLVAGWIASYDLKGYGCVAFEHSDGNFRFNW